MKRAMSYFVPLGSLALGLMCASWFASVKAQPEASEVAARESFENLTAREQDQVRNRAKELVGDEAELQRLRSIHDTVKAQPELANKLVRLKDWIADADNETIDRLRPSGEFAKDWKSFVEEKFFDEANEVVEIDILLDFRPDGRRFSVTEEQFYQFLDEIMLEHAPLDVQAEVNGYDNRSAAALAKCNWIFNGLLGGQQSNPRQMFNAGDNFWTSVISDLADSSDQEVITDWAKQRQDSQIALAWRVSYSGMTHFAQRLREQLPVPKEEQLVAAHKTLTRDQQIQLMANPDSARHQLELLAIQESGDESIRALLDEFQEFRQKLDRFRRYQNSRRGGRRSGSSRSREPEGRDGFQGRPEPPR